MAIEIMHIEETIRNAYWFKDIPEEGIQQLVASAKVKEYAAHSFLFQNGDTDTDIYCVLSGRLRLGFTSSMGQEFAFTDFIENSWLGETSLCDDSQRLLDVQAINVSTILVLPRKVVLNVGDKFPIMYRNMFVNHVNKTRGLFTLLAGVLFYPLRSRLAGRLLEQAQQHGVETPDGISLDISLSQNDFAQLVMGSRQRINKVFGEWRDNNIIVYDHGKYLIKDIDALKEELELVDED